MAPTAIAAATGTVPSGPKRVARSGSPTATLFANDTVSDCTAASFASAWNSMRSTIQVSAYVITMASPSASTSRFLLEQDGARSSRNRNKQGTWKREVHQGAVQLRDVLIVNKLPIPGEKAQDQNEEDGTQCIGDRAAH